MVRTRLVSLLVFALLAPPGRAHGADSPKRTPTIVLSSENDTRLFSLHDNSDRFYTNGWRLGFAWSAAEEKELPRPLVAISHWLPFAGSFNDISAMATTQRAVGLHFGQNMYTPSDIDSFALIPQDRPYAGWLYAGLIEHDYVMRSDDRTGVPKGFPLSTSLARVYSIELDLGIVGPGSGAQQFQTKWHEIIGIHTPKGWGNQIHNEAGVQLYYDLRWKNRESIVEDARKDYHRVFDFSTHVGGAVGNVFTNVRSSATARWGLNLSDDFGPGARIDALQPYRQPKARRPALELYVFGRGEGRGVIHNIFLEGNTFAQSHRVEPRRFVADLEWGWSLRVQSWRLTHRQIHRSPEFVGQRAQQIYGTVMLSFEPFRPAR